MTSTFLLLCLIFSSVLCDSRMQGKFLLSQMEYFQTQYLYFMDLSQWSSMKAFVKPFTFVGIMNNDYVGNHFPQAHKTMVVSKAPQHSSAFTLFLNDATMRQMKWVVFLEHTSDIDTFYNVYVPFDCEVLLVQRGNTTGFQIFEIYRLGEGMALEKKLWGTFSQGGVLNAPNTDLLTRRQNLQGHILRHVAYQDIRFDPDQIYQDKMITFVADSLNFTISSPRYSEVGIVAPNGTRTGVYKLLHDGQADYATHPLVVTPERLQDLSFIWPTTSVITHLFLAVGEERDWRSYLKPFDASLWYALAGWIILSGICLFQLYQHQDGGMKHLPAVADAFLHAMSPFCAQGVEVASHGAVFLCRLMPYLNALVLLPAYSAAVLAFLTVPLHRAPFQDISGFIQEGNYKLSFLPNTYIQRYFSMSESEIAKTVRQRGLILPRNKLPEDAFEAFQNVCEDHSQVFIDSIPPEEHGTCHILRLDHFLKQAIGIATRQHFPYKVIATRVVRRVHAAGLMKLFQEVRMPPAPEYFFTPIDMESVAPLFLLLCLLLTKALLVLLIERLIAERKDRKPSQQINSGLILMPQPVHTLRIC